jgi:O-antigen ligase
MTLRAAGWAVLSLLAACVLLAGFPAASPELRWAIAAALAFGLLGFASPRHGASMAAFGSSVAGGTAVLLKSAPLCPWPALIVLWFGAGYLFRRLVFSTAPAPTDPVGRALAPLVALWLIASAAAAISARSMWALFRGLDLRIINGKGMTDAEALAGNLNSLAGVLSGVVLYGVLRGLDSDSVRRALRGLFAGAVASGLAALFQARGWIASPRLPFWRMAGRLQGLSSDPNALGVLVGLAIPVAVAGGIWSSHRLRWWLGAFALSAGLAASGSRSGFLVGLGGAAILVLVAIRRTDFAAASRTKSAAWIGTLVAAVVIGVIVVADRRVGGLSQRLLSVFDRDVPLEFRVSARPILWSGAWEAWRQNPIAGLGWNAFSWQLPNVSPSAGALMWGYDNPGNFYIQVLTETGLAGMAIFLLFFAAVARSVASLLSAARRASPPDLGVGAAASLSGFAVAMFFGSHLLAAEVSCAAFLLLAQLPRREAGSAGISRAARFALLAAAAAWGVSFGRTAQPAEAFRHSSGIGFFGVERSPEGPFRWAGRRSAIRFLPGEQKRMRIVFRSPSEPAESFRIRSQGAVLFSRQLDRDRPIRLLFIASSSVPAILFLENSRSFRPSASGLSRDSRELSIQVFDGP